MPFLSSEFGADTAGPNRFAMNNATDSDRSNAVSAITRQDYGLLTTIGGAAVLGTVDLADTVSSSIPILSSALGLQRGTVNSAMLGAIGMPGLQDFYNDNKGAIEVASGIYGIIGAELVARKLTAPAGMLMRGLKTIPWARRIATLDAEYNSVMKSVRLADEALAARGALGAEQFVGRVVMPGEGLAGLARFGGQEVTRKGLLSTAKTLAFAKGVRSAAATEAVMAVTLNQNGFLYDDDMAHNALWMGLGLGIGGAFERVATSYSIRKFVNSDYIRRTYANALDPDLSEESRLIWHGRSVDPKKLTGFDVPAGQGYLAGSVTDYVTNLLVGAKSKSATETAPTKFGQGLFANRDRLATQDLQLAREEIQKATMKGIEGNGYTRFGNKTANSSGAMNHLDMVMKRDPGAVYGIEEIGVVPENSFAITTHLQREARIAAIIEDTQAAMDEAIESGDTTFKFEEAESLIRRYKFKQQFIPTPLIDGERATLSDLETLDKWIEPTLQSSRTADGATLWEAATENTGIRVGVDTNGQVYLPDNIDINKADHFDILRLYRAGKKMIDWAKGNEVQMSLPADASWFQLDLAEEILRVNPKAKIAFPNGMTREGAIVESFAQKAQALKLEGQKAQTRKSTKVRKGQEYDPAVEASKLRVRFNLPKLSAYERGVLGESEHPIEQLLRGASEMSPEEIRRLAYTDLLRGAAEVKRIGDFAPAAASDFKSVTGNSFTYMLDESGNPVKPVLMYSRPMNAVEWSPETLADRLAARKLQVMGALTEGDDFTGNLSKAIMSSPEMDAVARTHELMETQVQGSLLGSNHLSAPGAAIKGLKARDWIGRDNPTLLAASRMQEMVQRLARDNFQREASQLQTIAGQLDSPRNAASKLLLNQFVAYRPGWDLAVKKKAVQTVSESLAGGQTVHKFLLAKTEKNQQRWQEMFGEAMPDGAVIPGRNGQDAVLDDTGLQFMSEFNRMTESIRGNKNRLLAAQGLRKIDALPMYVPPKNLNGKFIGFTMDAEGNVVPGMTVIADTESEFARQQAKVMQMIEDGGHHGYRFRTRDDISRFADIWDRAQMDMIDPGTTAIQGGKRNMGALSGADIDLKGVEGILATLRDQYLNHAQDILTTTFKDQLRSAESRSNIATALSRNQANPNANQKYRTIHDMYIENLTGASPLKSKGSFWGGAYNWAEGKADQMLGSMYPGFARVWAATNSFIDRANPWDKSPGAKRDFESLTKYLGEYMPFKSAAEYMEQQGAGSMPPKLADLMGTSSRFTAAVMLRVFEPAMAVMNLAGMVNAMPSVIRHVSQQGGETAAEHAARIGHIANIFPDAAGSGKNVAALDMAKIMTKGFNRAWKKESHADYDYMKRNGFLTQEVAEFQKQFGAIETKADWERFMFGSPGAKVGKLGQDGALLGEKGLVGWLSIMTDKSEDFSRSWGHMVGLELADTLGITGLEARNVFAHDLANKMIANYNPANRPEVFQGALGAPLGLFQSFVMNYYQRMFRYIESKDYRSLATQYAMQSALFGVTTVPGFAEASKLFFSATDGESDPVAAIHNKFGQTAGDFLIGGTLSNIPKLFGAEGVDLYSRGDTAVRLPGLQPPPALAVGEKILTGMYEGVKAFASGNISQGRLAEIVSNAMPNRPLAGMIEQFFAAGNDTDMAGQLVSSTKSMMEGTYRILGVRSMRQSMELEAFYSNKNQMSLQNSQMDMLRKATRSAFREGGMDAIPAILEKYVEQGGDPRQARRWLKEQYEAATQTRAERQLDDTLKSESKMGYAVRLLDAGVSIEADEATVPYSESLDVDGSEFGQPNDQMMDYDGENTVSLDSQPY